MKSMKLNEIDELNCIDFFFFQTTPHLRLGLLVICGSKPYCLCSAKWRSSGINQKFLYHYDTK